MESTDRDMGNNKHAVIIALVLHVAYLYFLCLTTSLTCSVFVFPLPHY